MQYVSFLFEMMILEVHLEWDDLRSASSFCFYKIAGVILHQLEFRHQLTFGVKPLLVIWLLKYLISQVISTQHLPLFPLDFLSLITLFTVCFSLFVEGESYQCSHSFTALCLYTYITVKQLFVTYIVCVCVCVYCHFYWWTYDKL